MKGPISQSEPSDRSIAIYGDNSHVGFLHAESHHGF